MPKTPVIALLGGGQLGRMFIENALRYDVTVHVLDPDPRCSCAGIASRFVQGRFDDRDTVLAFARDADVVGIEIEHVSVEALEELERMGKRVIPSAATLRTIKDKGLQKTFYRGHGIPTSDFALIDGREAIAGHAQLLPAFLKLREGGYDGRGVMPITGVDDAVNAFDGPCVLEKRVAVAKELAVIAVLHADGSCAAYDPVEMVFDPKLNLVDVLVAPADVPAARVAEAQELARRVAQAFAAPGIYAVEMFLSTDGELLVNETAPRAHNSGHHTIEACHSSQYDQLLRLYMGWPMGDTRLRSTAAMVNLIGEGGTGVPVLEGADALLAQPGAYVHLYGKAETRTGRKMGHVTLLAEDRPALDRMVDAVRGNLRVVPAPTTEPSTAN